MRALSFVGPAYSFENKAIAANESINYYLEVAGDEGRERVSLRGTPGLQAFTNAGGSSRGLKEFDGIIYALNGTTFSEIDSNGVLTNRGTIGGIWRAYMAQNNANEIVICDKPVAFLDGYFIFPGTVSIGYIYNTSTNILVQITDPDFGLSSNKTFFISGINDGLNYDPLEFSSPDTAADNVLATVTDHRQLLIFGEKTIEFWNNTGDATFTFERQTVSFIEHGTLSPDSIAKGDETVFWLGADGVVYRLQGLTAVAVSPAPITEEIEGFDLAEAEGAYHTWRGHKFYSLTFPTPNVTLVYDASLPPSIGWHKRQSRQGGAKKRWRVRDIVRAYGKTYASDAFTGDIWEVRSDVYTEGADILEASRVGHYLHADHKRIIISSFEIIMKTGTGAITLVPQAALSVSKDYGRTFQNERWQLLGITGDHTRRVKWRNVANVETAIAIKVRITDAVNRDIVGVVGEPDVGTA